MNTVEIEIRGQKVKFYPKGNKNGHYFEMGNGHGFYTKDMFKTWGKPLKNNCVEVATFFIESSEGRIKTFDSYESIPNSTKQNQSISRCQSYFK